MGIKAFSILSISIFKDLIFVEWERKFHGICVRAPAFCVFPGKSLIFPENVGR